MTNTLHLVSHTHWDREWYLTFQQFRMKLVSLIDELLEILENDGDYKYYMLDGQTIVLEDYLEIRPENEDKLMGYIHSGRLIIGPWYILPDEFLVSPEATIRNLLEGDQICKQFGGKMKIGYIPDPFGHISQIPQILNGIGIHTAVFRRGLSDEPVELNWEAPDGSRVFVSYLRDGYDNAAGLPTHDHSLFTKEVCRLRDSLIKHSKSNQVLLMQGTDHMRPQADTSEAISSTKGNLKGDVLIHSTLETYIDAVKLSIEGMQIPLIRGELRSPKKHHLLPGVLSTRMWIKQQNYSCEILLEKWAEPFSTINQILDNSHDGSFIKQPYDLLHRSWKLLMQNHPHDSICGCSIDQVHDEMKTRFDQVEQIGEEIALQSLTQISNKVNTNNSSLKNIISALIVYNPNSFTRTDLVNCDLNIPSDIHSFLLVDLDGNEVPFQTAGAISSELINMKLDKDGLKGIIGSIHEGKIGNLSIQSLVFEKEDATTLSITTELAENHPVNQSVWENATKTILQYFQDSSVKFFHVRAFDPKKVNTSFCASDVPSLGWKTIFVQSEPELIPSKTKINWITRVLSPLMIKFINTDAGQKLLDKFSNNDSKPPYKIENEFFLVELNQSGTLDVFDKRNSKQYQNMNLFLDGGDCGDEYNYCPPQEDRLIPAKLIKRKVKRGKILETLEAELIINVPAELTADRKSRERNEKTITINTRVQLICNVPRIDISTNINNTARDHRLRVHFPIKSDSGNRQPEKSIHDGHFDVIERQIGIPEFDSSWVENPRPEVPQRAFSDVSTDESGLMVANLGLPEVEILNGEGQSELVLTLMRSVGWLSRDDFPNRKGHAGPFLPTPKAQMEGNWKFDYSIIPHSGKWDTNQSPGFPYQQAYGFNSPMRAIETSIHNGELPSKGSFIKVTPDEFIISSIKQTSDLDSWIIRGYNLSDMEILVNLTLWKQFSTVILSNLLEESLKEINPDEDGKIKIPVLPHQILTIKVWNN